MLEEVPGLPKLMRECSKEGLTRVVLASGEVKEWKFRLRPFAERNAEAREKQAAREKAVALVRLDRKMWAEKRKEARLAALERRREKARREKASKERKLAALSAKSVEGTEEE